MRLLLPLLLHLLLLLLLLQAHHGSRQQHALLLCHRVGHRRRWRALPTGARRSAAQPPEQARQGLATLGKAWGRRREGRGSRDLAAVGKTRGRCRHGRCTGGLLGAQGRRLQPAANICPGLWHDDVLQGQRLDPLGALAQGASAGLRLAAACWGSGSQVLGEADLAARVRLLQRAHDVAVALQPHRTDVAQARILQQLRELGVPEGCLAELRVELGAEDALDVGEGDGTLPRSEAPEDLLQAGAHGVPGGEQALALGGRRARPLVLGAALLHHGLRALVGDHGAVQVPEELLLRDGELHDVADLAKRPAREEGQSPHSQHLCAEVAPPRQNHAGIVQALKVGRRCAPEFCRVDVLRAVDVDEGLRASAEECGPVAPLLVLDGEPRAGLAMRAQQLDVDVNGLRPRCHSPLVEPLAEDSAVGPELVRIQRLQCRGDLGHVEGVWLPRAGRPAQCRGGLCARRHGDGTDQRRCLHDGSSRHRPRGCAWSQRP
mmetsp:Transcript_22713/g.71882  ORF Transcript_22713/g.71882 Transcript_22713/m.71882 type:complete len:490 (+) Transcript_22713:562-2031(+)